MSDQNSGKIVVGVDSSEPSKAALRWAARQTELTGASLRVVGSWYVPMPVTWIPVPEPKGWDLERATREKLDRTVLYSSR